MMRRPTTREGVILPRFAVYAALVTAGGGFAVSEGYGGGWWLVAGGAVSLLTAGLVFWRIGHGAVYAAPLWFGLAGAVALRLGDPGGAGDWLLWAGVLMVASLVLAGVNRRIGGGLALAGWLVYAGLLLRALPERMDAQGWWLVVVAAGGVVAAVTVAQVAVSRSSSRGLLRRLGRAGRETDGMASAVDAWRGASARVLRAKAAQLRPHLAAASRWQRRTIALGELGVKIARVGLVGVYSAAEDHTITFGGPRKGKTQQIMKYARKAPGALITTSTKLDLLEHTYKHRAKSGPVWVFDPSGVVQPGSRLAAELAADERVMFVRFNPLNGCEVAATAMDRAADLIDGVGRGGDSNAERWDGFAKHVLKSLLHAAALGGYSMYDVQRWVANPSDEAMREVLFELKLAGKAAAGMVSDATQFFKNNPATQSSITTGIMPALSWLSVESAVEAAAPGGQQFDIEQLLAAGGSVYLLGKDDNKIAPLVTSLTADLARRAEAIAAGLPAQRLDPFLTMVLDEAALICLIPLDKWAGDFGSRGICMHIAAQSRAQMRQRFGDAATGSLLTNVATKVVFGGSGDADDLQYWSTLAGERDEPAITRDRATGSRQETVRRTQVLTPGQVGELRARQMLVISNNMPPVVVKTRMYYQTWDVRVERFRNRRTVQALTTAGVAVEARIGGWLLAQTGWLRGQVVDLVERGEHHTTHAARRVAAAAARRLAAGLAWLDANDPAREFVARLRLSGATRKAHAALKNRTPAQPPAQVTDRVDAVADAEGDQS